MRAASSSKWKSQGFCSQTTSTFVIIVSRCNFAGDSQEILQRLKRTRGAVVLHLLFCLLLVTVAVVVCTRSLFSGQDNVATIELFPM